TSGTRKAICSVRYPARIRASAEIREIGFGNRVIDTRLSLHSVLFRSLQYGLEITFLTQKETPFANLYSPKLCVLGGPQAHAPQGTCVVTPLVALMRSTYDEGDELCSRRDTDERVPCLR